MPFVRLLILLTLSLAIAACGGDDPAPPPPEPQALLAEGISQLQAATSFRYEIDVSGYPIAVSIEGVELPEELPISFKHASGTLQVPDRLSARIQLRMGVLSMTADLVALHDQQFFRGQLLTGNRWLQATFIPGFVPSLLLANPGGIPHTLSTISDLTLVGRQDLNGLSAYHLSGQIEAEHVFSLTLGLSRTKTGPLAIDVFVQPADRRVARIVLVEPPPEWAADAEPTRWQISLSDYSAPVNITAPTTDDGGAS
jgi:hypothetical protein